MPCRVDDWDLPKRETRHGMTIEDFEAVLCGILSEIEFSDELDHFLGAVDWDEVGVSRKRVEVWWKAHKKEDERRRAKEAAELRKAELKAAALAKLTPEERAALGL